MSHYLIRKSSLSGEVAVPPSKSQTLRAILFASLAEGKSTIFHYLSSPDTFAMVNACRLFGAKVDLFPDRMEIEGVEGKITSAKDIIDAGNSGIVLRFCSAIGALGSFPIVVTGDDSVKKRPMKDLLSGLLQLGVSAESMRGDGFAPVVLQGPIKPGKVEIVGEDSQPVSALLIASAFAQGETEIVVRNPGEKPWVALTLDWFARLGIPFTNQDYRKYYLHGHARHKGFTYTVPGDLSTAAFPIVAALITQSELLIKNIDMNDCQGDKKLIYVLQKMGACIDIDHDHKTLYVKKGGPLRGIDVDINDFIDACPILSVAGCFADGVTTIRNAAVARNKECNRISSVVAELKKMGAKIFEQEDGIVVEKSALKGAELHSYHDHRMAMSLAVAGMGLQETTKIGPVSCVSKTFPTFVEDFRSIGAHIEESA